MCSLITKLSSMPLSVMPVKRYNQSSNTHFNTHNVNETSTLKRISDEFSERYSENSFLKNLKPTSYSRSVQSMNLHRKSIEWFLFQIKIDWK